MTHLPSVETLILPSQLRQFPDAADAWRAGIQNPEAKISMDNSLLANIWEETYGKPEDSTIVSVPGVLGIMGISEGQVPTAVMSVDIDDVLKDTARTFMELGGFTLEDMEGKYDYSTPFGISQNDVRIMLQGMGDAIDAVSECGAINELLQRMRRSGAYIVANTPTLPGCEAAAIRALERDYPGVFNGILFPRGGVPGQQAVITKGDALLPVIRSLEKANEMKPILGVGHVDDAPKHIKEFRQAMRKIDDNKDYEYDRVIVDAIPAYPWNEDCRGYGFVRRHTPLQAINYLYYCLKNEGALR